MITDEKVFEDEKAKLIQHINYVEDKGEEYYDGRDNLSFGLMSKQEWSNIFSKHLDHHLNQFGV
ncbi:MAG: hypothetical protein MK078_16700 [Crocinitomicaceae bacterium]|nr:hypothetical protein [Crocinitomicaceae bacterium]